MDISKITALISAPHLVRKLRLTRALPTYAGADVHWKFVGDFESEQEVAREIESKSKGTTYTWKVEEVLAFQQPADML